MSDEIRDPIVAEIHAIRQEMLAEAGGDIDKLMEGVIERQRQSSHRVITTPFKERRAKAAVLDESRSSDTGFRDPDIRRNEIGY